MSFKDAKYAEVYVSVKLPIPEGMTYEEMEEHAWRTMVEIQAMLGEMVNVEDGYWVYRDEDDNIVNGEE